MQATKFTVTIEIEVLSLECIPNMMQTALTQFENGVHNGQLTFDDGDDVSWKIQKKEVVF